MRKKIAALSLFLLLCIPFALSLQISEVMYSPEFDENFNEYIEIYNNEDSDIDITLLTLCSSPLSSGYISSSGEEITSKSVLSPGEYALITDGGTGSQVLENYDVKTDIFFHPDSSSLCSRLSNTGKQITIEKSGEEVLSFTYEGICKKGESYYDKFCSTPTPGYAFILKSQDSEDKTFEESEKEAELATEEQMQEKEPDQEQSKNITPQTPTSLSKEKASEENSCEIIYASSSSNAKFYILLAVFGVSVLMNLLMMFMLVNK